MAMEALAHWSDAEDEDADNELIFFDAATDDEEEEVDVVEDVDAVDVAPLPRHQQDARVLPVSQSQSLKSYDERKSQCSRRRSNARLKLSLWSHLLRLPSLLTSALLAEVQLGALDRRRHEALDHLDILSRLIELDLWHVSDAILASLDAISLVQCQKVLPAWKAYMEQRRTFRRLVRGQMSSHPTLMRLNGWRDLVPCAQQQQGGERAQEEHERIYKALYWKLTNLSHLWQGERDSPPKECKRTFKRPGRITWRLLPNFKVVSVFAQGKGFVLKIHKSIYSCKRSKHMVSSNTLRNDKYSMDACDKRIVVGGYYSERLWVFNVSNKPLVAKGHLKLLSLFGLKPANQTLRTSITRIINTGSRISEVQLNRVYTNQAVVHLPLSMRVEILNIDEAVRLKSFVVPGDTKFIMWERHFLVVVPTVSGLIQVFDTLENRHLHTLSGMFRQIDCAALYQRMLATGEKRSVRLWDYRQARALTSWIATRTFITALMLNDLFVVSGSASGVVKVWELKVIFGLCSNTASTSHITATPALLRKISMKGIMHYPIKSIYQWTCRDLVVVSKYETRKRKDKVKVVTF